MQVTLASNEIKEAIVAALSNNINVAGKHVEVTFTSGRSRNDLTATVVISNSKPAGSPAEDVVIPGFSDGTQAGDAVADLQLVEGAKDEQAAGDALQAAEQHTPATTGSLFKPATV